MIQKKEVRENCCGPMIMMAVMPICGKRFDIWHEIAVCPHNHSHLRYAIQIHMSLLLNKMQSYSKMSVVP